MHSTTNSLSTLFEPVCTGTITEALARAQQERIKAIMAERKTTFEKACDAYIKETWPVSGPPLP